MPVAARAKTSEGQSQHQSADTSLADACQPDWAGPYAGILTLQRAVGNRTVSQLLQSGTAGLGIIQPKLMVGPQGDVYEQEADRVAETVMRMPELPVMERSANLNQARSTHIQRLCSECEEEVHRQPAEEEEEENEETVQAKTLSGQVPEITPELETGIQALTKGGQPLPESVRGLFEPRLGFNLSQVRVHTDAQAAETAQAVNAHAFTLGNDVVFGVGQYAPETPTGQRLLAHELTHVAQQTSGMTTGRIPIPSNKAVSDSASRATTQSNAAVLGNSAAIVQRETPEAGLISEAGLDPSSLTGNVRLQLKKRATPKTTLEERGEEILDIFAEGQGKAAQGSLEADIKTQHGISETAKPGGRPVPEKFDVGNFSHQYAEELIPAAKLPRGLKKEFTIELDGGTKRLDRVDQARGRIYEIKPNTRSQVEAGKKQVKLYEEYMNRLHPLSRGRKWKGEVVTYDRKAVIRFLKSIGWLEK